MVTLIGPGRISSPTGVRAVCSAGAGGGTSGRSSSRPGAGGRTPATRPGGSVTSATTAASGATSGVARFGATRDVARPPSITTGTAIAPAAVRRSVIPRSGRGCFTRPAISRAGGRAVIGGLTAPILSGTWFSARRRRGAGS